MKRLVIPIYFLTLFKVPSWCKESWSIGEGHFTFCFIVPPILFIGYKILHWKLQTSSEEKIFKSRYPSLLVSYFFSILFFLINIEMIDWLQKVRKFLNSFSHIPFKSKFQFQFQLRVGESLTKKKFTTIYILPNMNILPFTTHFKISMVKEVLFKDGFSIPTLHPLTPWNPTHLNESYKRKNVWQ